MTLTWVWPTSTVHLVGSFILGHIIAKVGATMGRRHCDNVLITVSVTPAVLQFSGPEPITAAGYATGEKNVFMVLITSHCMKWSDNVIAHRVSNCCCYMYAIDFTVKFKLRNWQSCCAITALWSRDPIDVFTIGPRGICPLNCEKSRIWLKSNLREVPQLFCMFLYYIYKKTTQ